MIPSKNTHAMSLSKLSTMLALGILGICGCGGNSSTSAPPPVKTPTQTISLSAFANPVPAGTPGFQTLAGGSGFTSTTAIFWNGTQLATTYESDQILSVSIPSSLLVQPGTAPITAKDTATGVSSNAFTYAILSSAAAGATVVSLISSAPDGVPGNGDSLVEPSISATGRFVVFQSPATNLVSQQIITPWQNIYMADTCMGVTTPCTPSIQLISVSADGTSGGNFHSRDSTVSQDGRYVAYDSQATNLVANTPSYCNTASNCVYLRDTCMSAPVGCKPQTTFASILPGEQEAPGAQPAITASGRYLTYVADAAVEIPVYLRDLCVGAAALCTPKTVPVSVNSMGAPANQGANEPAIASDGRFSAFVSYSTNLTDPIEPSTQNIAQMFLRDNCIGAAPTCTPSISRIDVPNTGGSANAGLDYEAMATVSATGRYVAFASDATNLVAQNVQGFGNVYVRDTCFGATGCTPQTTLVSIGNDGSIGNAGSHQSTMSADGRFIAFTSIATNLVWGLNFPAASWQDIYVRDTCAGAPSPCYPSTVRVAVNNTPAYQTPSNAGAAWPVISADGHYVAFLSSSTNLTAAGTGGHTQVFLSRTGF